MATTTGNPSDILKPEFDYYRENQAELVARYDGRYVVIKGREVLGDYESLAKAVAATTQHHAIGTFLVQKVSPGTDDYTMTFHSRVTFT